jgi:hypothetical protein
MRNILVVILLFILNCQALGALSPFGFIPFYSYLGPRAQGLSGSVIGISGDPSSIFFNPGELSFSNGVELGIKDFNNIYGMQVYPTGYGLALGLGLIHHSSSLNNDTVRTSFSNLVVGVGFTLQSIFLFKQFDWAKNLGFGVSAKSILGQTLHQFGLPDRGATGFEVDAGIGLRITDWLKFGASANNILPLEYGGKISWDFEPAEEVPLKVNGGLALDVLGPDVPIKMKGMRLTVIPNYTYTEQKSYLSLGFEYSLNDFLFLRTGTNQDGSSFGVGLRQGEFGVDASYYVDPETKLKNSYVSFSYFPKNWVFLKLPEYLEKNPIIITDPKDEIMTYDPAIWIKGKIKPDITLKINTQDVVIDEDQNFAAELPLNIGKNLILFDCYYQDRKVTYYRKVFRRVKVEVAQEEEILDRLKKAKTDEEREKFAQELKEVKKSKENLETLATMGVVDIDPEEKFNLKETITRGELVQWLSKVAGLTIEEVDEDVFKDIPRSHYLAPYIKAAVDADLVSGFPDNTFRPEEPVTQQEAEKIFAKFGITE